MSVTQEIDDPRPMTPGPEMEALRRFHKDVTWSGTIHEGGMGLGRRRCAAWDGKRP